MVIVHAFFTVKEGAAQAFESVVQKCAKETRKEPGCLYYTLYSSTENPLKFVLVEEWESISALENHFTLPHFIALGESVDSLLTEPLNIKKFQAQQL